MRSKDCKPFQKWWMTCVSRPIETVANEAAIHTHTYTYIYIYIWHLPPGAKEAMLTAKPRPVEKLDSIYKQRLKGLSFRGLLPLL